MPHVVEPTPPAVLDPRTSPCELGPPEAFSDESAPDDYFELWPRRASAGRHRVSVFDARLGDLPGESLGDLGGFGDAAPLRHQAWNLDARGEESAAGQFLDVKPNRRVVHRGWPRCLLALPGCPACRRPVPPRRMRGRIPQADTMTPSRILSRMGPAMNSRSATSSTSPSPKPRTPRPARSRQRAGPTSSARSPPAGRTPNTESAPRPPHAIHVIRPEYRGLVRNLARRGLAC